MTETGTDTPRPAKGFHLLFNEGRSAEDLSKVLNVAVGAADIVREALESDDPEVRYAAAWLAIDLRTCLELAAEQLAGIEIAFCPANDEDNEDGPVAAARILCMRYTDSGNDARDAAIASIGSALIDRLRCMQEERA